ncbi:BQ5605_C002g01102 [Microbotryum silenes-dioicae]|uniref:BQ5605_C002g01102 protein n=1 Tax=Microbotryum silenes-dioicae TaxID=796604 RepID=A0A2X0M1N7_9BASI|nr:BQ5605_C002g01102 [Microbotryum silenes-dioicae]
MCPFLNNNLHVEHRGSKDVGNQPRTIAEAQRQRCLRQKQQRETDQDDVAQTGFSIFLPPALHTLPIAPHPIATSSSRHPKRSSWKLCNEYGIKKCLPHAS